MIQNLDVKELAREQAILAKKILINNKVKNIKVIAGCDVVNSGTNNLICVITVMEYPSLKLIEKVIQTQEAGMPYLPKYLAFRNGEIIVNAYANIKIKPDVMFIAGHGIDHPKRIGLASQIGLQLGIPAIGVSQSAITGFVDNGKLIYKNEVVGIFLKTKQYANPILISPGHLISLNKSIELAKNTIIPPHKLPEPLFLSHKSATREKKKIKLIVANELKTRN